MKRSLPSSAPVVTLLSSSVEASKRSQEILNSLFGLEPFSVNLETRDQLSHRSPSFLSLQLQGWDSVTCQCPTSGTLLHLLSPGASNLLPRFQSESRFSLLSITGDAGIHSNQDIISQARSLLASQMEPQTWKIAITRTIGRSVTSGQVLGTNGGLPVLDLPTDGLVEDIDHAPKSSLSPGLKEVAIPFYIDSVYPNGMTLQSTLSRSMLSRPSVGLYQWPSSRLVLRPLPAALEDRNLAPPTLVFKCESLDQAMEDMEKVGATSVKIGFSGTGKGQLVVRHPNLLPGMEVRFCEDDGYSSVFAEAQESLLAGSIGGLQNKNVLLEGGAKGVDDNRIGVGDCWIEFRATVMNPSGFWKSKKSTSSQHRIAKAPDLPYE